MEQWLVGVARAHHSGRESAARKVRTRCDATQAYGKIGEHNPAEVMIEQQWWCGTDRTSTAYFTAVVVRDSAAAIMHKPVALVAHNFFAAVRHNFKEIYNFVLLR